MRCAPGRCFRGTLGASRIVILVTRGGIGTRRESACRMSFTRGRIGPTLVASKDHRLLMLRATGHSMALVGLARFELPRAGSGVKRAHEESPMCSTEQKIENRCHRPAQSSASDRRPRNSAPNPCRVSFPYGQIGPGIGGLEAENGLDGLKARTRPVVHYPARRRFSADLDANEPHGGAVCDGLQDMAESRKRTQFRQVAEIQLNHSKH